MLFVFIINEVVYFICVMNTLQSNKMQIVPHIICNGIDDQLQSQINVYFNHSFGKKKIVSAYPLSILSCCDKIQMERENHYCVVRMYRNIKWWISCDNSDLHLHRKHTHIGKMAIEVEKYNNTCVLICYWKNCFLLNK